MSELNTFWKTLTANHQQQDATHDLLRGHNL
jgi:hypothetical protein